MTVALVSLPTAVEIALALLACLGFFLLLAWLERRRPLTAEEKAASHPQRPDAWSGFAKSRKDKENWELDNQLYEIASFTTTHQAERIVARSNDRRAA